MEQYLLFNLWAYLHWRMRKNFQLGYLLQPADSFKETCAIPAGVNFHFNVGFLLILDQRYHTQALLRCNINVHIGSCIGTMYI